MIGREVNFKTDKYKKPVYLSKRDSVAQMVLNALFMKQGNYPSHPDRYVDIEQYLGKPADSIDELRILADLKRTCGETLVGDEINNLTFSVVRTENNMDVALILVSLLIDNTEDLMAIAIQKEKDNVVRYKYSFINEAVPI